MAPSFNLSLSSSGLYISAANPGSVTVSVTGSDGFDSSVSIAFSSLPTGVSVSPSSASLTAGQSLQFMFSAASSVSTSSLSVSVKGNSGNQSQQVALNLQINADTGNVALPRTRYVRTDAVQPYTVLFDSGTNRFFMSDPGSNQIFAFDAGTRQLVGSIILPGAYGMDEAPDHSVLYTGTQVGDVYAINPVTMAVTQRYPSSQIGPKGYQAYAVQIMANGELALLGGQGGDPTVDGYSSLAFWNPVINSLQTGNQIGKCASRGHIFAFEATGDRSLLVLENQNTSGATASELCTIDPVTGQTNSVSITGLPVTPTPDGKSILVLGFGIASQIEVFDAQTLAQTATLPVGDFPSGTYMVVSPDSSTVYLAPELGGIVSAFSLSTGAQVGWIPDLYTEPIGTWISAIDNTGLLAGVNVEGIGFLDAAAMQTGPVGRAILGGSVTPNTGAASGGTSVNTDFPNSTNLAAVYFGQNLTTAITSNSSQLYATTPAGSAGPVDVVALMTDGSANFMPEAFSYGPTILEVTPNASTAEGTGTCWVFGYGFNPASLSEIPQGFQVSVGGQAVQVTALIANGYLGGNIPATPVQAFSFTIPPGTVGTVAAISVTTPSGTTTLQSGIQYLPAVQPFPLTGSTLAQGIYDPYQDAYYFTDANKIQVFSKTQGEWLTPISIPAPNGATQRLWGIALSPDGTELAVADISAGVIYELSPTNPESVRTFPVSATPQGIVEPVAAAVSNNGTIYYATMSDLDGAHGFFKLNTSTGAITDYGITSPGLYSSDGQPQDVFLHTAISADNSKVFFNQDGAVFTVETANDHLAFAAADPTCCYGDYDLTLSSGQTTLEATSYLYDTNLNAESYLVLNDQEANYVAYVYGTQLSPDGLLLFQPSTNGIDVYDGQFGVLLSRIALPVSLSQNYDALVGDGKDNVLIAITGNTGSGIAIIDLSSLPDPPPANKARRRVRTNVKGPLNGSVPTSPRHKTSLGPHTVPKFKVPHVANRILVSPAAIPQARPR